MPPDVKQRALSALWRLLMMLGMFGVGYILWDFQVDSFPAFLVPSSWFLYCYMLFFPTSPLAAAFLHGFDRLQDDEIKILIAVFSGFHLLHLYRREPVGMFYIVALCIVHFCITQLAIYRAAMVPAPLPMCEAPQPDAPGAEAEDPDDTATETDQEASLAAEPEHSDDADQSAEPDKPVEPEQMDGADPSHGPPDLAVVPYSPSVRKVFEPQPQVSGTKGALWSFLLAILTLGSAVLLAHALVDWSVRDWVLSPSPVDISPLFEAEGFFQANKTELPIPVPHADFIPTGTFASPCQAAPMPTPVDKSTMWRGIAAATPMPTPMPAPTPTAMPEPEPTAVPDEPIDVLERLFDFDLPDPKPLLKWYFSLPPASQYTVIVISFLVLWCLSKPLITLAAHLVVLAIAYLASAAVLALLLIYGFTPERSLAIVLPADLALIVSIWWAKSWLKNLASTSSSNTAGLTELKNDLEGMRARSEQRLDRADSWITLIKDILKGMTKDWADSVVQFTGRLNKHGKLIETQQTQILALIVDKARHVDLDEIDRTIDELSDKIDCLETSKGDADLLRTVQRNVDGLRRMAENIRTEKADAEDLEQVQEELKDMTRQVDELQNTKADAKALEKLAGGVDQQVKKVADVQEKLTTRVADLESKMDGVREEVSSVAKASDLRAHSITTLQADAKEYNRRINNLGSQVPNDRKTAKDWYDELKEENTEVKKENADLKLELGGLKSDMKDLMARMGAVEAGKVNQEDLQQLRNDDASDVDQKINQRAIELRSETDSKHEVVMQAHRNLEANLGKRFAESSKDAEDFQNKTRSSLKGLDESVKKQATSTDEEFKVIKRGVKEEISDIQKGMDNRVAGIRKEVAEHVAAIWSSISDDSKKISLATERVEALEKQGVGSISQLAFDNEVRLQVEEYVENYLVSDKFRTAVNDAQLILKKQSKLDQVRNEVRAYAEERIASEEFQERIFASIKERKALDNKQASSPGIGPFNSHAAPNNTNVSSDNTSTLTIPDELRDDADDHHGTRGVPLGDGDDGGPRPSGEGNDGTLRLKQQKGKELCEPGSSTGAQLSGPANPEQAGDEQNSNDGSTSRQPKGLANSMFASPSSSGSGVSHGPGSTGGGDGASGAQDQAEQKPKRNPSQGLRRARYFEAKAQKDLRKAMVQMDEEKRQQREGENLTTQEQETLDSWRGKLQIRHASHQRALDRYLKAQSQSKQEQKQPGEEKGPAELSLDLLEKGKNLLDPTKAWQQLAEQQTEQDEETEEKESDDDTDDDDDDDAHDGGDDDEPDDDDAGPPPGSGGSHGHDGTDGNDDDDQDGNDDSAPPPPRQTRGLANSKWASPPSLSSGSSHEQESATGEDGEARANVDEGAQHQAKKGPSNKSRGQVARENKNLVRRGTTALEDAIAQVVKEGKQPQHAQNEPTIAQKSLKKKRDLLERGKKALETTLDDFQKALNQEEQAEVPTEQAKVDAKPADSPRTLKVHIEEMERLLMKALPVLQRANSMLPQRQNKPVHVQPQSLHSQAPQIQMQPRSTQQPNQPTPLYTPQAQQAQYTWPESRPQQGHNSHMQSQPQQGQNPVMQWSPERGMGYLMQSQPHQGLEPHQYWTPQQGQNPHMQSQPQQGQSPHMPRPSQP